MTQQFTASEVRDQAEWLSRVTVIGTGKTCRMLNAFADLLEAREIARNDAIEREYERENNPATSDAKRLAEALRKIVDIDYVKRCCNNGIEVHYPDAPPEMECCDDPDVDFGPFAQIAMDALGAHSAQAQPPVPKLNIRCETKDGRVVGSTYLDVVRVETEDDGSFTAVTNFWPQATQPPAASVTEDQIERACRVWCADQGWDADASVTYAGTRKQVCNRDGSVVKQWEMHIHEATVILQSALLAAQENSNG